MSQPIEMTTRNPASLLLTLAGLKTRYVGTSQKSDLAQGDLVFLTSQDDPQFRIPVIIDEVHKNLPYSELSDEAWHQAGFHSGFDFAARIHRARDPESVAAQNYWVEKKGRGSDFTFHVATAAELIGRHLDLTRIGLDMRHTISTLKAWAGTDHYGMAETLDFAARHHGKTADQLVKEAQLPITKYCDEVSRRASRVADAFAAKTPDTNWGNFTQNQPNVPRNR